MRDISKWNSTSRPILELRVSGDVKRFLIHYKTWLFLWILLYFFNCPIWCHPWSLIHDHFYRPMNCAHFPHSICSKRETWHCFVAKKESLFESSQTQDDVLHTIVSFSNLYHFAMRGIKKWPRSGIISRCMTHRIRNLTWNFRVGGLSTHTFVHSQQQIRFEKSWKNSTTLQIHLFFQARRSSKSDLARL